MRVRLENLTKKFDTVVAVDDFSMTFEDGQLVVLLGPSGCGKSTLLNMLSGILPATEGKIYFDDEDVTDLPPQDRGVGLVFQNYALYPHMTVLENIAFPLEIKKVSKQERWQKAKEMAKLVHVDEYLDRKPRELSGGQQQRVAIARALIKQPRLLLLDEPLSNLDARLRLEMREEIRRIQQETKVTTIFVTHDQEEAMSISDEIVVMNFGVVQQIGVPQDVYNEPINEFVAKFLGTPPINIVEAKYNDGHVNFGTQEFVDSLETSLGVEYTESVHLGFRPEFFRIEEDGKYQMDVEFVEYIGRDKTVVFRLPGIPNQTFKCIVPSGILVEPGNSYKFSLTRYYIFDDQGRRIK